MDCKALYSKVFHNVPLIHTHSLTQMDGGEVTIRRRLGFSALHEDTDDMWTGGAEDQITKPEINGHPALPPLSNLKQIKPVFLFF